MDGSTTLGTGSVNGSGVATFTTSTLSVAVHPITATYGGNSNFLGSTSATLSQTVNSGPVALLVSSQPGGTPIFIGAHSSPGTRGETARPTSELNGQGQNGAGLNGKLASLVSLFAEHHGSSLGGVDGDAGNLDRFFSDSIPEMVEHSWLDGMKP
jgi:hypothetical protein